MARSRLSLSAENAILRHQLAVLQRGRPRPFLRPADRVLWIWLCRHWNWWRHALVLIQPATVLKWHRAGYRCYWRRRSGGPGGRPRIPRSHINLIRRISSDHPEWGEDRIALELKAKLGVVHPPSTIRRYMVTRTGDGAQGSTTITGSLRSLRFVRSPYGRPLAGSVGFARAPKCRDRVPTGHDAPLVVARWPGAVGRTDIGHGLSDF